MTASDIARKLATHPKFRWREGMRDTLGFIVTGIGSDGMPSDHALAISAPTVHVITRWRDAIPDLTDPATAGALEAIADEEADQRGGSVTTEVTADDRRLCEIIYNVTGEIERATGVGASRGEAAARALLALWWPA